MAALAIDASPFTVRIGIMGCASIAKKNARAIIRSQRCTLVAVASRELDKAQAFCNELELDRSVRRVGSGDAVSTDSYNALLNDKNVDAVYIPLPTKLHKEWVLNAAAAGKHILVEKPVGVNANEVSEMIAACRAANVAFMDGTMFVHHQRFKQIDRLFGDSTWQPKRVTSAFTFAAPIDFLAGGNIRTNGLRPASFFGIQFREQHVDAQAWIRWAASATSAGTAYGSAWPRSITSPHTCGRASGRRQTAECLRTWTATSVSAEAIPNARSSRRGSSRSTAVFIIIYDRLSRRRRATAALSVWMTS